MREDVISAKPLPVTQLLPGDLSHLITYSSASSSAGAAALASLSLNEISK